MIANFEWLRYIVWKWIDKNIEKYIKIGYKHLLYEKNSQSDWDKYVVSGNWLILRSMWNRATKKYSCEYFKVFLKENGFF